MQNFADEIAKLCLNKYKSLAKTGKPSPNEWTILSGIVLQQSNGNLQLVSLATGTKCIGRTELSKQKSNELGSKLGDSHAEVLARRAFLRYLYEQFDLLISNSECEVFYLDNKEVVRLRDGISFHFFTSQTPCGDCSIFPKKTIDEDVEPSVKIRRINENNENGDEKKEEFADIYRTGAKCLVTEMNQDPRLPGANYHKVGPLRTKPGRGDPTLSLSCSDKLAKWNVLGLQGALLSILIPDIKMGSLIVGGGCPFSLEAMERGLYKRFNLDSSKLKIVQANLSFEHQKKNERSHPCPSSIIWSNVRKCNTEIAVEGRKQGATKKRGGGHLLVSKRSLFETFLKLCDKYGKPEFYEKHPKKLFYINYKHLSKDYQRTWSKMKEESFSAWPKKPLNLQKFVL